MPCSPQSLGIEPQKVCLDTEEEKKIKRDYARNYWRTKVSPNKWAKKKDSKPPKR